MKLENGREIDDTLLDNIIDTTIVQHMGLGLDESLSGSIDLTIQSLQEDPGWLPDGNNLTYEEACEVMSIVEEAIGQFANELSQVYFKLQDKYVGTRAWELYRKEVKP